MAKRKSDIFTVIEVVPNYFEASEGVARASEVVRGTANWFQAHDDTLATWLVTWVRRLPPGFRPTKTR